MPLTLEMLRERVLLVLRLYDKVDPEKVSTFFSHSVSVIPFNCSLLYHAVVVHKRIRCTGFIAHFINQFININMICDLIFLMMI